MKKRFIINFLYVVFSIIVIYGYVEAATEVLSNKYATLSECTSDKDKYNIQFPDYVRSTCFAKDGGHYYTICQKGETCNTPVTTQSNQTLAVENIGGENPFAKSIPPSIKIKMDAIVSALETKQKQTGGAEMEIYLNNFLSKLGTLRSKYAGKKAIEDILGYLEVETKRIKEGNSLNDFLCDLTGDCNASTGTNTGTNTTAGTTNSNTTTSTNNNANTGNTSTSPNLAITRTGWMTVDTNCNINDITVGNQTWAGCNSTLGTGVEYTGTASTLGIDSSIGGKFYTWANQNSACPTGWKVPSRADFQSLFNSLVCQSYSPGYATSVICPGLGWLGNGNTFPKTLKLPLPGYKDTRFSSNFLGRGSTTYLATSTLYENNSLYRRSIMVDKNMDKLDEYASPKTTEYSVRCIKDNGTTDTNVTGGATLACSTKPSYLTSANTIFINGTPTTTAQQTWQNSSSSASCYYSCRSGYTGNQCTPTSTDTTDTTSTTTGTSGVGNTCTRISDCSAGLKCSHGVCASSDMNTSGCNAWGNARLVGGVYKNSSGNSLCYDGYTMSDINANNDIGTLSWSCIKDSNVNKCISTLAVDATCGSAAGQPIEQSSLGASTPNVCAIGEYIKTTKPGVGTKHEYLIENTGTGFPTAPASWANVNYLYTCGGLNGGKDIQCRTGKVKKDGQCGWGTSSGHLPASCDFGTLEYTDEVSPVDGKHHAFRCIGYNGGTTATCISGTAPTSLSGKCGEMDGTNDQYPNSHNLGIGNFAGWDTRGLDFVHKYIGSNPPASSGDAYLCNVSSFGDNITGVVNITDNDGTDGTYNWECYGKKADGSIDSSNKSSCSVKKLKVGQCGTLNGGKISGKKVADLIPGVYPFTLAQHQATSAYIGTDMTLGIYFRFFGGGSNQYPELCANGSYTSIDSDGTDGTYNWKCAGDYSGAGHSYLYNNYSNYNSVNCSADRVVN